MTEAQFDSIFEQDIKKAIDSISNNNALIEVKNLNSIKPSIYADYQELSTQYKKHIFNESHPKVMDRHRIASCLCGAFLKNEVFDTTKMIKEMKANNTSFEAGFIYSNEVLAMYVGFRIILYYKMLEYKNDMYRRRQIRETFPILPEARLVKTDLMNIMAFNLKQVKDVFQIGVKHLRLLA